MFVRSFALLMKSRGTMLTWDICKFLKVLLGSFKSVTFCLSQKKSRDIDLGLSVGGPGCYRLCLK